MAVIKFNNLTHKARTEGSGRIDGSRIAHQPFDFKFGGETLQYTVDDWVNDKGSSVTDLAAGAVAVFGAHSRFRVKTEMARPSTNEHAITGLLNEYIFGIPRPASTAEWAAPPHNVNDFVDITTQVNLNLSHAPTRTLAMHLLSVRAAMHWRFYTMEKMNIGEVNLQVKSTTQVVTFDWNRIWEKARAWVEGQVAESNPPPSAPPSSGEGGQEMNVALTSLMEYDEGLRELARKSALKTDAHSGAYEFKDSLIGGKANALKGAFNHLRFVMYLEWRTLHEIAEATK